ncbi:MAG TPA: N-6 DNA methylase [Pirellulales bacterium]|nr:N-6 DNA methylase [Pirellulales bacterium]
MVQLKARNEQIALPFNDDAPDISVVFKKLYFHLYTNSNSSRAERLVSDLALLLLTKLAVELNGGGSVVKRFLEAEATADETLVPLLRRTYGNVVDERDRFGMGDNALRESLRIIDGVQLSQSPAHVLGDAFQALIGPRLRGDKGQFFTPRSLVRAMVEVVEPMPGESVLDPACGTGGFLSESHRYQLEKSRGCTPTGRLVGIDKDHDLFRISSALLGITSGERAKLYNLNALDTRECGERELSDNSFDVVLTNPPFGTKIGVRDMDVLREYALAHAWIDRNGSGWHMTETACATQDPQVLFLELCVRKLKPGGRLGIVLPEGVFGNKRAGYIWHWLRSQGKITSLLDCPRTTFQPGTDTKTNVLFFTKGAEASRHVRIAVALNCGHDRRGRTRTQDGRPYPDDFAPLSKNSKSWKRVELRHQDYLVPRYYLDRQLTREEATLTEGAAFKSLAELCENRTIKIRKGHEVGSDAYGTGEIPFVRTSDVTNFEVSVDPTKAVSESIYAEFAPQQQLRPGDLLIVVDGRYRIGTTALLTPSNVRCIVQSHFRIISVSRTQLLDATELMFALNLPSVKMQLRNLVFVQSTLGTLGKRLLELEIPILHGDGPWTDRVASFKELLRTRDESLSVLKRMITPDYEL